MKIGKNAIVIGNFSDDAILGEGSIVIKDLDAFNASRQIGEGARAIGSGALAIGKGAIAIGAGAFASEGV